MTQAVELGGHGGEAMLETEEHEEAQLVEAVEDSAVGILAHEPRGVQEFRCRGAALGVD